MRFSSEFIIWCLILIVKLIFLVICEAVSLKLFHYLSELKLTLGIFKILVLLILFIARLKLWLSRSISSRSYLLRWLYKLLISLTFKLLVALYASLNLALLLALLVILLCDFKLLLLILLKIVAALITKWIFLGQFLLRIKSTFNSWMLARCCSLICEAILFLFLLLAEVILCKGFETLEELIVY